MSDRIEIRLSGSGGQGMVLGAIILAEAAAIFEGKNATQSQSYGPEARGGSSKSDVVLSDGAIEYPKATKLDILLAMTQESCDKYCCDLRPGGLLIVDEDYVTNLPETDGRIVKLPIMRLAAESVGKKVVANIVALGALVELTGVVSEESLRKAVLAKVPKGTEELNTRALQVGIKAAQNVKK
ncbi:MAG TPA: 2-oxoacid:acceptor oxidoreductase family protein [Acidobacteriota bacterium]|nr:2-oxoacid:acceptor oxidoreductase family protein [Acidobacteriota bacterium]